MSNTMKELWDAFKGQLVDRLSNPFTGALVIAWCLFNFRLLVVLIWIEPYQQKFAYIDGVLYPTLWHWTVRAIALPIIAAYGYLLFYPKVTMWAATRYRRAQSQANNEMRAAQGEALMTHEENQQALIKIAGIEKEARSEVAEISDRLRRQDALLELEKTKSREHKERADRAEKRLAQLTESSTSKTSLNLGAAIGTVGIGSAFTEALKAHPPGPANPFPAVGGDAATPHRADE